MLLHTCWQKGEEYTMFSCFTDLTEVAIMVGADPSDDFDSDSELDECNCDSEDADATCLRTKLLTLKLAQASPPEFDLDSSI